VRERITLSSLSLRTRFKSLLTTSLKKQGFANFAFRWFRVLIPAQRAKGKYDSVRVSYDAAGNKLKTISRKKTIHPEHLKQAEQEYNDVKQQFEDSAEVTLSHVNDVVAQHEFRVLE
jgi:hypothetical protein